jgi:hypothetical protein
MKLFDIISKILMIIYFSMSITIVILCVYNRIEIKLINYFNERSQIDCELKELENCYITLHNFISIPTFSNISNKPEANVKTYIYSVSKPFLSEILNKVTEDCLCCSMN